MKKVEIEFLNLSKDNEEVRLGIKTNEIPLNVIEINFEDIEEYRDIFKGVINILSEYSTRLITIISEPVPLKIPFHFKQTVLKGKKMIQTDCIEPSNSDFLAKYFSENEYRLSKDFLCIGEVETWESRSVFEFTHVSFTDLKGLFSFSEDQQLIQCIIFESNFEAEFLKKLKKLNS
ncbi:MAG: hypothetical protein R3250_07395 [Melioribacteraceae bacterium]|nr:hypothetical protein [Melioribacteraceae bacterium]